jgi:hypothetical protein
LHFVFIGFTSCAIKLPACDVLLGVDVIAVRVVAAVLLSVRVPSRRALFGERDDEGRLAMGYSHTRMLMDESRHIGRAVV